MVLHILQNLALQLLAILFELYVCTGICLIMRSRFGEISSCCCLSALPGPAWVLLNYAFHTILCTYVHKTVMPVLLNVEANHL